MPDLTYDTIAETIFAPIYPIIAENILRRTGVREGKLLDLGCGGGHLGFAVMERTDLTGCFLDISPEAVNTCQRRGALRGFDGRFIAMTADVHQMPLPDDYADLIVSRGSIGFWGEYEAAFREIHRVLSPTGRAYIGIGLGNTETREAIHTKMKQHDPDWPKSITRNQQKLSTEELVQFIEMAGLGCDVIENPDEGRWFVLWKEK